MYAQRFADGPRFRPTSLAAALAINGAVIAALLFANPELIPGVPRKRTEIFNVTPQPEPTREPVEAQRPLPEASHPIVTPTPVVTPITPPGPTLTGTDEAPLVMGTGTGNGAIVDPIPPIEITPPSPFIPARQDPRYVADFQPPYPDFERDAGREDVVKLRVRIGIDGRVKQVERLAGRDSFARVAAGHALAKWRFKPATRGDVPEESWIVMTVRFTLND